MAFLEDEADSNSNSSSSASSAVSAKSRVARATSTDDAAGAPSTSASGANTPSGGSRLSTTIGPNGMRLPRPGNSQRPELRIVTLTNEEVSADALPIMGYANYMAQDYRLDFNPNGSGISAPPVHPSAAAALGHVASAVGVPSNSAIGPAAASNANTASNKAAAAAAAASANLDYLFYILAPHDIVVAKPRDYDDHITWLLARSKYEEALHYAHSFSAQLKIHNSYEIGENFLKYLFEVEKNYIKAAEYCSKLLGNSKSLWETYILLFAKHDKLSYIAPVIPVANPTLSDHIYELVLNSYLHQTETHGKLLTLIKTWSHHLYHIKHVIESIRLKLVEMENSEKEREKKMGREAYWKEQQEQDKAEEAAKAQKDKEAALEAEKEKESKLQQEQQDDESKKNSKAHIFAAALAAANAASSSKSGQLDSRLYPAAPLLPPRSMRVLYESLAELYVLNKQYSQAFDIYLKLQRKDELFRILTTFSHQLLESKLLDERNIVLLMKINLHSTLELLLNFQERIQTKDVMEQLKQAQYNAEKNQAASPAAPGGAAVVQPTYKVFQYEYLHALFRKDHSLGQKFHDEQVLLYAEFNPKELLYFLKNSSGYLLEKALESCEKYKLYSEMVFLLKRMGNTNMALKLIIDELHDVKEAINFVEENGGRSNNNNGRGGGGDGDEGEGNSLWEELITRSLNNPLFLSDLLEHVGSHYVDLSKLIQRIPPTLEIPSLKQKLITILNDCELQQSVIKGCTNILRNDCKNLIERLYRRRKRAMKIPVGTKCSVCDVEIVSANGQVSEGNASAGAASGGSGNLGAGVLIFFCRHVMHRSCYDSQRSAGERRNDTQCPKCNAHSAAHGHTPNTYTAPQQQQQQQQPQPLPSAGKFSGLSTPSVARMAGHAPPPQMASTPHKRSGSSVPSASPPSAGFPSRSPSSSQSPATNYQRSILPAPSPNAVGPASHLKRPVIPLPQSANVLPRGAVAGSATTPSASTPSSSASAAVSHVRSASPLVGGGTGSPNPALMTPTGHTPTAINAIKPQAAFNRPPSNRNSVSMGKP